MGIDAAEAREEETTFVYHCFPIQVIHQVLLLQTAAYYQQYRSAYIEDGVNPFAQSPYLCLLSLQRCWVRNFCVARGLNTHFPQSFLYLCLTRSVRSRDTVRKQLPCGHTSVNHRVEYSKVVL